MTNDELEKLIPFLRRHGVAHFESGDVTLKFEAMPAKGAGPMTTKELEALGAAEDDRCKCGHATFQHTNGLCVVGCSLDVCVGDEATQ